MGEFTFSACKFENRGSLFGFTRWKEFNKTPRGPVWRKTGKNP